MPSCKSCGADITWAVTEHGNRVPLDAKPAKRFVFSHVDASTKREVFSLRNVHTTHFETCPNADQHRKPKP